MNIVNLFGYDVTEDAAHSNTIADTFLIRQIDAQKQTEWENFAQNYAQLEQNMELPLPAKILQFICTMGLAITGTGILSSDNQAESYRRIPWIYWLCGVFLVCCIVLYIWRKTREKHAVGSPEHDTLNTQAETLLQQTRQALGIPDDALELDVLAEKFIRKDGKPKHKSLDGFNDYQNLDLYVYVQNGTLYLADVECVWAIPCTSLRSMERIKQRCSFPKWNKQEPPDSKTYKRFKITTNQFGTLFAHCYRVEIADAKGDFYLLIPDYDAESFTALTGLRPNTEEI